MAAAAFLWSIAGLFIKAIDWNPFAIAAIENRGDGSYSVLAILTGPRRPEGSRGESAR